MTISSLRQQYPEKICICRPRLRDAGNLQVVAWECLKVTDDVDAARGVLERLDRDGVTDSVAISTSKQITIDEDLAARYCRVFFGMG